MLCMCGNKDTGLLAKRNILMSFDQNEKEKQLNKFWIQSTNKAKV